MSTTLTPDEIREITGYEQPAKQLMALHARGFIRAYRDRLGRVILERPHYEAVCNGTFSGPDRADVRKSVTTDYKERSTAIHWTKNAKHRGRLIAEKLTRIEAEEREHVLSRQISDAYEAHMKEKRAAIVRHHAAKRRAAQIQRTPPWVDLAAIFEIYQYARDLTRSTGVLHHVDHIIPLQGRLVSGLHVPLNLRAVPWLENLKKGNRSTEELENSEVT